ncbi:hypothetical protein G9A89_013721 [Geosiphon pyriformis]|nr:hypothetical protein G9A89_013721 [Geosiphon pyriformis]
MELVGSSAGGSGSDSAGLGTRQSAKNKRVDTVYAHSASYKKPKKPAASVSVKSSTGPLYLKDLGGNDSKPAASWGSRVDSVSGNVSGHLDVKNLENLVAEKTSYVDSGENDEMNKTMLHRTRIRTYVLKQSLKAPLFATMNNNDNNSVLPPPKINRSNQLPSSKSCVFKSWSFGPVKLFALDVNLLAIPSRTNSDKFISIKNFFYKIDGFGGASTPSKFPGVIRSTFTSESSLIKAREMAVHEKIVVNGNLKKANIHSNREVIIKEIPVDFPKLAVESVFSKFGRISSKVASLVASKWSVLVGKNLVCVVLVHQALLYTLLVGTTAHDFSGLLDLYSGKTCVIGHNPVTHEKKVVTNLDRVCLASIYKKKQAPVTRPVSFGERTWALVVGAPSVCSSHSDGLILGSNKVGKPLPSVVNDLKKHLVNIESSLNQGEDIVMGVGLGDATGNKTAAVVGSTASPEVVKLETMLEGLAASVMSLLTCLDGLALTGDVPLLPLS